MISSKYLKCGKRSESSGEGNRAEKHVGVFVVIGNVFEGTADADLYPS